MKEISRILIDVDASAAAHPALDEALRVAARSKASVTLVDVLEDVPPGARAYLTERLEGDLVARRLEQLTAIAARVKDVPIATGVLRGRPATALIREVVRSGHDLLVRSHGRDLDERGKPFGARVAASAGVRAGYQTRGVHVACGPVGCRVNLSARSPIHQRQPCRPDAR